MLTITADAAEAIRGAVDSPELPQTGGLRISTVPLSLDGTGPAIGLELVAGPSVEDLYLIFGGPCSDLAGDRRREQLLQRGWRSRMRPGRLGIRWASGRKDLACHPEA